MKQPSSMLRALIAAALATACSGTGGQESDAQSSSDASTDGAIDAPVVVDAADPDGASADSGSQPPTQLPPGNWALIWADEFNGATDSPAASHWFSGPAWADGPRPGDHFWRDAVNSPDECFHDGQGSLVLRTRYFDGERRACYLTTGDNGDEPTEWHTFGPQSAGLYIEFRANVSQMRAFASWFALWLMSPNGTYDGDLSTGSEIDIVEYVPFVGTEYSLMNLFHTAVWWELPDGTAAPPPEPPYVDDYGQVSAPAYGQDLTVDGFHTWGLEWYEDSQRFYFDGNLFWTNTDGVSTAENHAIRMTIEIQNGDPYNIWGHPVGAFEDNDASRLPSQALVDYVRVYRKQ